jgi:hypothetical protein
MATYTAESKIGWRTVEIRDVIIAIVLAIIPWVVLASGILPGAWWIAAVILGVILTASAIFFTVFNYRVKSGQHLRAGMNTEGWQIQWWGHRPVKAVWSVSIDRLYNTGSIDEVEEIRTAKRGIHDVFEFVTPRRVYTLPLRLANTDGVRDFLLAWVEGHNNELPIKTQEAAEKFVAVLNRGRSLEPVAEEDEVVAAAPEVDVLEETVTVDDASPEGEEILVPIKNETPDQKRAAGF